MRTECNRCLELPLFRWDAGQRGPIDPAEFARLQAEQSKATAQHLKRAWLVPPPAPPQPLPAQPCRPLPGLADDSQGWNADEAFLFRIRARTLVLIYTAR